MGNDRQLLIGRWKVLVKNWVWEYEFSADGSVKWRDTKSFEKGSGRWSMSSTLLNLSWFDSSTKETWTLPLSAASNKKTWYSSPYYTGPYQIEKVVEYQDTLPSDWEVDIETGNPQSESNYIDKLCTHVAYGIYNGGFYVYLPPAYSVYPILLPENLVWFRNSGQRISDQIYGDQASANTAVRTPNPDDRILQGPDRQHHLPDRIHVGDSSNDCEYRQYPCRSAR
jgi:hypothetical protein